MAGGRRSRGRGRGTLKFGGGWGDNDGMEEIDGTGKLAQNNNNLIDEDLGINQAGGRYTFDLSNPAPGAAAPWAGGIPPVQRLACESASTTANSLNKHMGGGIAGGILRDFYSIGKKQLMNRVGNIKRYSLKGLRGVKKYSLKGLRGVKGYSMKGLKGLKGLRKRILGRGGGKFSLKQITRRFKRNFKGLKNYSMKGLKGLKGLRKRFLGRGGGNGLGVDNVAYYAPTAGYENKPSTWLDSVGAPVQLQIPNDAKAWNPSCLTTK
jgi:hypothetical protein